MGNNQDKFQNSVVPWLFEGENMAHTKAGSLLWGRWDQVRLGTQGQKRIGPLMTSNWYLYDNLSDLGESKSVWVKNTLVYRASASLSQDLYKQKAVDGRTVESSGIKNLG